MDYTCTWNMAQQSRVCGVEMSYLRGASGVTRWESESNESVYERNDTGPCANGVKCGVVGIGENKYVEVIWSYGEKE